MEKQKGAYILEVKVFWQPLNAVQQKNYSEASQARPFKLKKSFNPFFTVSENIFPARNEPATFLFISPKVG